MLLRGRVLRGESGNFADVRNLRTFSGALCSENQDVPGSSSSSTSSSSSSESLLPWAFWVMYSGVGVMCAPGLRFEEM